MKKESKKRATAKSSPAIDRPFDPAIMEQAKEIAKRYQIVLEPDGDDCAYIGSSIEMPYVLGDGDSADECVNSVRESLAVAVAFLLEKGETPPAPAAEQVRNKQVNIRVSEVEQRRIKQAALAHGFTDISDYVRSSALSPR